MVGIIQQQKLEKEKRLAGIAKLLRSFKSKKQFTFREGVVGVMDGFDISNKTATDYLDIALRRLNLKRGDVFK